VRAKAEPGRQGVDGRRPRFEHIVRPGDADRLNARRRQSGRRLQNKVLGRKQPPGLARRAFDEEGLGRRFRSLVERARPAQGRQSAAARSGLNHRHQPSERDELSVGPRRGQGGGELGLAPQNHAVGEDFEIVRGEGRACGGDVDHELGAARRRRALGGAGRLDDTVVCDALQGEEGAGLAMIFRGDPQSLSGAGEIELSHLLDVSHGLDIDPALRRGHDEVGAAKPERAQERGVILKSARALAQHVLARDAEVNLAGKKR